MAVGLPLSWEAVRRRLVPSGEPGLALAHETKGRKEKEPREGGRLHPRDDHVHLPNPPCLFWFLCPAIVKVVSQAMTEMLRCPVPRSPISISLEFVSDFGFQVSDFRLRQLSSLCLSCSVLSSDSVSAWQWSNGWARACAKARARLTRARGSRLYRSGVPL